jgi:hypothetical protein
VAIYPLFGVDLDDVGADMAATVAEAARRLIAAIGTAPVTGADAPPSLQVELMPEVLDNLGDMDLLGAQEPAPGDAMPPSAPA